MARGCTETYKSEAGSCIKVSSHKSIFGQSAIESVVELADHTDTTADLLIVSQHLC